MKIDPIKTAFVSLIMGVLAIPFIIFILRAPVLIVTEEAFIGFYGAERIRREGIRSSLSLFRPLKTVEVANDAGDDIVPYAVDEVSKKPYCVLFPLRFARSARLYHELKPEVPAVILEGRFTENAAPSSYAVGDDADSYFIYKTDIEADFYRVGAAAAAIDGDKNGRIVVFLTSSIQTQAREAFLRALQDQEKSPDIRFFTSFAQFSSVSNISCVVMAGIGYEFFENHQETPVILYSWLDPVLIPDCVTVVIDDSPWTQAAGAVRLVEAGETGGRIPSKFDVIKNNFFNRETLQKILKKV